MCFCKNEWDEKVRVFFLLFWNKALCSRDLTRATVDRCHQISSWEGERYHGHRLQCGDTWGPIHRATEQPWSCSSVPESCLTLCNMLGSSVHGISQAGILEWVAVPFSRGSSQPRDRACISCSFYIGRQILYH